MPIITPFKSLNGDINRLLVVFSDFEDGISLRIDKDDYIVYKEVMHACKVRDDEEKVKRAPKYISTGGLDGRILKLVLPGAFAPHLPGSIAGLTSLTTLIIRSENIKSSKSLSRSVCDLSNLKYLRADHLYRIPEHIGQLCNLTTLYLGKSSISYLPRSIGRLRNLTELYIYGKDQFKILRLPNEIGGLSSLIICHLVNLKSLPKSFGRLKNLKELNISQSSYLDTLPEEIGDLRALVRLIIYWTSIESLPRSIGRLQNLKELLLQEAKNLQRLPEEIGDLGSLETLELKGSNITSLPRSIGRLKNLWMLNLRYTTNLQSLPVEIGDLRRLTFLEIDSLGRERLFPKQFRYEVAVRRTMLIDPKSLSFSNDKSCEIFWKLLPKLLAKAQRGSNGLGFDFCFEKELYGPEFHRLCYSWSFRPEATRIYWFLSHHRELFIQVLLSREASKPAEVAKPVAQKKPNQSRKRLWSDFFGF